MKKYQLLVSKSKCVPLKHGNDHKAFVIQLRNIDYIYENIAVYNPNKKRKLLIVFDDMIADMINKKPLTKSNRAIY